MEDVIDLATFLKIFGSGFCAGFVLGLLKTFVLRVRAMLYDTTKACIR